MDFAGLKPIHKMRKYPCRYCGKLMMRYGSFRHEFPEYKELRVEKGFYRKDGFNIQQLFQPNMGGMGKPIGIMVRARCAPCGQINTFTIIFNQVDKAFKMDG